MATSAVDRHRGAGGHDLRHHVVQVQRPGAPLEDGALRLHLSHEVPRPCGEEPGRHHGVPVIRPKGIAGDLFLQESIVGLVCIECLDDVVAVRPGVGTQLVALKTVGIRIVRDVQPMLGEALAVVGRGEQLVDQFIVGLGIRAVDKRLHRLWLGRQAKQIKIQAANKGAAICLRRRLELPFLKPAQDKGVNRVSHHRR